MSRRKKVTGLQRLETDRWHYKSHLHQPGDLIPGSYWGIWRRRPVLIEISDRVCDWQGNLVRGFQRRYVGYLKPDGTFQFFHPSMRRPKTKRYQPSCKKLLSDSMWVAVNKDRKGRPCRFGDPYAAFFKVAQKWYFELFVLEGKT